MKALTVQQPWAWAIVQGGKDVENRTQSWKYRGPLAIHAGGRVSARGWASDLVKTAWELHLAEVLGDAREVVPALEQTVAGMTLGAVVGLVDLVGVHTAFEGCCESPWGEQAYDEHGGRTRSDVVHLKLERPRVLAVPVPCRGALGLWTLPVEVRDDVLEQLVTASAPAPSAVREAIAEKPRSWGNVEETP